MKDGMKDVVVIECESIQLEGKDVFFVSRRSDFLSLAGISVPMKNTIFKLGSAHYVLHPDAISIYQEREGRN